MVNETPHIVVIAGPNGAGKSTAASLLLPQNLGIVEFVNADVIARGLSGFAPERAAMQAGRVMLKRLDELTGQRVSFAFETTLASRTFAPWIAGKRTDSYRFQLIYLWIPDAELSVRRVRKRVESGGHDVPEETIRRRYIRGLANLFELYRPIADK